MNNKDPFQYEMIIHVPMLINAKNVYHFQINRKYNKNENMTKPRQ